jgi:hypothetical protein
MSREGLIVGRRTVAEEPALRGAHLEEAEILAVLRRGPQVRLAPSDRERLMAMSREDCADRLPRRERREPTRVPDMDLRLERSDRLRELVSSTLSVGQLRVRVVPMRAGAQERAMRSVEPDGSTALPQRRDLASELLIERERVSYRLRLTVVRGGGLHRCRSGLRHESERKQANEYGSQTCTS